VRFFLPSPKGEGGGEFVVDGFCLEELLMWICRIPVKVIGLTPVKVIDLTPSTIFLV